MTDFDQTIVDQARNVLGTVGDGAVLLIDPEAAHAKSVARVLRAVVPKLDVRDGVAAVADGERFDIVVANYDALSREDRGALLRRFESQHRAGRVLVFTAAWDRAEFAAIFGDSALTNVLARSGDLDPEELLVTITKIVRGDIFGLDKYFPWGVREHAIKVERSTQRDDVVAEVKRIAEEYGAQGRFAEAFCSAADELVTNAVYNAPTDAAGKARFAHWHRTQEVVLTPQHVDVKICSDGRRLGISVSDPWGSLRVPTIVGYLAKCLRGGDDQVDQKEGGAGLGLFVVFEALSHFVVNLHRGRRTEMIGLLDIRGRYKDFAARPKSLNVFVARDP